ncbi:MAG TPA: bifunctional DNA primase/polymerase, partial [Aquihabitans sp.]|nr:bifunctional DNA primase/polymerase [Aquihabitans sp.]
MPDVSDMDAGTAALTYGAAGIPVLPVLRGSKSPGSRVGANWHHQSTTDARTIVGRWSATTDGIALHVGRCGWVAFDVDHPERLPLVLKAAIEEHRPPFQATRPDQPGRGHYLFAQPPGRSLGNANGALGRAWGEVRGRNGVIIAAPSVHADAASGAAYQWLRVGPVPVLPEAVAELLPDVGEARAAATPEAVRVFLAEHTRDARPDLLAKMCRAYLARVLGGASRHEAAVAMLAGAMAEARGGNYPAAVAEGALRRLFIESVTDPTKANVRTPEGAAKEWSDMLAWAVAQADAADMAAVANRVADLDRFDITNWVASAPSHGVVSETGEIRRAINLPAEFWGARPLLGAIRDHAHYRGLSADALFAIVAARACAMTPVNYHLPAIVGARGSLNVITAIVGPTGTGKSTARAAAAELLPITDAAIVDDLPLGSGEGLIDAYFEMVDEPKEGGKGTMRVKRQTKRSVLAVLDEGQVLAEIGGRKGATILQTLRSGWSGTTLGQGNAGVETRRVLTGGKYRLSIVANFQTAHGGVLLD